VEGLGLGHRADHGECGHPVGPLRAQRDAAGAQGLFQSAGGGASVADGHHAAGLGAQLRGGGHGPGGHPAQQFGLDLGAHAVVGDGSDVLEQRPQVPGVQQTALQGGQGRGQPVHQDQRPLQQRLGALGGDAQRDRQLRCRPLTDRAQHLRAGRPPLRAHRPGLALGTVGRGGAGGGELGHRSRPHRRLAGDLPIGRLHRPQRTGRPSHRRRRRDRNGRTPVHPRPVRHHRRHAFDHTFEDGWRQPVVE
jgi:hypothetical protein